MTRTTSQLRKLWAPGCVGPWARLSLYGMGVVTIDPLVVEAARALSAAFEAYGYETRREDTGAYNCRGITRPDGSRDPDALSLHAFGIAIDANWTDNPYGPVLHTDRPLEMDLAIERIRTKGGHQVWRSGRFYRGNKDAMHNEVVASPAELALGIDWSTVPGHQSAPTPQPTPAEIEEQELMAAKDDIIEAVEAALSKVEARLLAKLPAKATVVRRKGDSAVFVVSDAGKLPVQKEELNLLLVTGQVAPWPNSAKGTSTIPVVEDSYLDDLATIGDEQATAKKAAAAKKAAPPAQK